jgi:hypothetical protein
MRVYFTTTVACTDVIFRDGFTDLHEFGEVAGAWVADRQLDISDGFEGDVTLCLEVADDLFERYEWAEDGGGPGHRSALIPAAVLNRLGPPQVYDHGYAGGSRRDLIRGAQQWEEAAASGEERTADAGWSREGVARHAREMRDAIEFFDRIGWLTPLKLREGKATA